MVNSDWLFLLPLGFPLIAWVVVGVMAATTHRHGVSVPDLIAGSVGAGLMLGAIPVCVFFLLGRALARHLVVLGLACAASADAYECPV